MPHVFSFGTAASAKRHLGGRDFDRADEAIHEQAKQLSAQLFCQQFHSAARDLRNHKPALDLETSHLSGCKFPQYKPEAYSEYKSLTEEGIAEKSCKLLSRLPSIPLPLGNVTSSPIFEVSPEYHIQPDTPGDGATFNVMAYPLIIPKGSKYAINQYMPTSCPLGCVGGYSGMKNHTDVQTALGRYASMNVLRTRDPGYFACLERRARWKAGD